MYEKNTYNCMTKSRIQNRIQMYDKKRIQMYEKNTYKWMTKTRIEMYEKNTHTNV